MRFKRPSFFAALFLLCTLICTTAFSQISIPVGGVQIGNASARPTFAVGGATLSVGQCVYKDATDSDELKATDVTTSAGATCVGVLLQKTADGEGAVYLGNGCELKGPTFTKGTWYVCDNSGQINTYSALTAGEYVTFVGYGTDSGTMMVQIIVTGFTK
jgi:hypothetical protein